MLQIIQLILIATLIFAVLLIGWNIYERIANSIRTPDMIKNCSFFTMIIIIVFYISKWTGIQLKL